MTLTKVLPNNYRFNNREYHYKIIKDTPVNTFLNTSPLTYEPFLNLKMDMIGSGGQRVVQDVVPLKKVDISGGGYRIYWEDLTISLGQDYSKYYFVIYDQFSEQVVLKLNCFELIPIKDIGKYTRLSYRNSSDIFGFNYKYLPDFRNVVFVDLNDIGELAEYEDNTYTEATTGFQRMQKSQLKNYTTLQSHMFDQGAHNAMKALSQHDDIQINFNNYKVKKGYEYELNLRSSVEEGTIELYIQEDNEINLKGY